MGGKIGIMCVTLIVAIWLIREVLSMVLRTVTVPLNLMRRCRAEVQAYHLNLGLT